MKDRETVKHESFGQISFTRTQGRGQTFYGSELPQDHYVSMEIRQSELSRDLTSEWYRSYGVPLIRIRMSSGQFAELITSMNMGRGIPCTIERLMGKKVDEFPEIESRKELVHRKFEERMKQFADTIRENKIKAKEIVKKKTLSKDDVRELSFQLDFLTQEIEQNIPFFAECFQETMDKVVLEAKKEVENAIQHKINVLGLSRITKPKQITK
jgi:hypothetical protein